MLYAIKANNNLAVRAILHQEGAGGDCFGEGELYATFMGGADPRKIVMNGASKTEAELRDALAAGVAINVDSEDEIEMLATLTAELGVEARIALRLRTLPRALAAYQADYFSDELSVLDVISEWPGASARRRRPAHPTRAIHFRPRARGLSQPLRPREPGSELLRRLGDRAGRGGLTLHRRTGYAPAVLDVGGGYARSATRNPERWRWAATRPRTTFARRPARCAQPSEPPTCRYPNSGWNLDAPSSATPECCSARSGRAPRPRQGLGQRRFLENQLLNAGKTVEYHILAASKLHEPSAETAHIMSPLCAGVILGKNRSMPRLARGDLLVVLDAGMYAESQSRQFNGQPRPATVLVNDGRAEIIEERETVLDVFARHRVPPRLR